MAAVFFAWQQGALDFLGRQTRRLAQPAPMQSAESVDPGNLAGRSAPVAAAPATGTAPGPVSGQPGAPAAASAAATAGKPAASATVPAPATQAPANATAPAGQASQPAAGLPPVRATAAPAASAPASGAPAPAASAQAAPAQTAAVPPAGDTPAGQHKLIITATEECWIHSSADKTDTRQFSLRKGDTFALTFSKSLELKLGNAGGVRLRYDGEELPQAGQSGQVRNLTFPPADRQ